MRGKGEQSLPWHTYRGRGRGRSRDSGQRVCSCSILGNYVYTNVAVVTSKDFGEFYYRLRTKTSGKE